MNPFCPYRNCITAQALTVTAWRYSDLLAQNQPSLLHLDTAQVLDTVVACNLDEAILSTYNGHAMISGYGRDVDVQYCGSEWCNNTNRATLRVGSLTGAASVYTAAKNYKEQADSLQVFDRYGALQHRIVFDSVLSSLAFETLPPAEYPSFQLCEHSKVVSLTKIREAREKWDNVGQGWHLDAVTVDGGVSRLRALPHVGREKARRINVEVLAYWFWHLQEQGFLYSRLVPGECWMQCDASQVLTVRSEETQLIVDSGHCMMVLDVDQIGQCWETRFRENGQVISYLEIYSHCGRCMAILAPYKRYALELWTELTATLPDTVQV